ncbi:hypothetical protein LINPERHAP2_LOCUS18018 [Linum perenne]
MAFISRAHRTSKSNIPTLVAEMTVFPSKLAAQTSTSTILTAAQDMESALGEGKQLLVSPTSMLRMSHYRTLWLVFESRHGRYMVITINYSGS